MSSITATWQTAIRMRLLDWYRWMPASAWVYIPFLTSSVPDLSFDGLVINSDCTGLEFHSYRCSGLQGELISWKPSQQLRLPHRGISDKHNLEDIVYSILVLAIPGHHRWRVVDRSISKAKLLNFCKSVEPILKSLKNIFVLLKARLLSPPPFVKPLSANLTQILAWKVRVIFSPSGQCTRKCTLSAYRSEEDKIWKKGPKWGKDVCLQIEAKSASEKRTRTFLKIQKHVCPPPLATAEENRSRRRGKRFCQNKRQFEPSSREPNKQETADAAAASSSSWINSRSLAIHHLLMKILNKRRRDEAEITENTHTHTHTAQKTTTPFSFDSFLFWQIASVADPQWKAEL